MRTDFIKGRAAYYSIYENGALKVHAAAPGAERKTICIGLSEAVDATAATTPESSSMSAASVEEITPPSLEMHDAHISGTALSSYDTAAGQFLGAHLLGDDKAKLHYPDLLPFVHSCPSPDHSSIRSFIHIT